MNRLDPQIDIDTFILLEFDLFYQDSLVDLHDLLLVEAQLAVTIVHFFAAEENALFLGMEGTQMAGLVAGFVLHLVFLYVHALDKSACAAEVESS